jgi:hypothetical protein
MKQYAIIYFTSSDDGNFKCFFEIFIIDINRSKRFFVKKVLVGNDNLDFDYDLDNNIFWKFVDEKDDEWRDPLVDRFEERMKFFEFEDDDSALLWYRFYGCEE